RIRGNLNPVLVMGAGYDAAAEDAVPPGTTTMGNAVVILDAFNGTLIKSLPTLRSVTAPVALMDADSDGYTDRGYVPDVGGNVYRVDFETAGGLTSSADWVITRFASLGAGSPGRKFFYGADVMQTQVFTALML